MTRTKKEQPDIPFEQAIEKVEAIVEAMEGDQLPLDELIKSYESGTKLLEICQKKIEDAQQRIEMINARSGGEVSLEAFDPADDENPPETASKKERPAKASPKKKPTIPKESSVSDTDEIRLF